MEESNNYFDKYVGTIEARIGIDPGTIILLGVVVVGAMWAGHAGKIFMGNTFGK